MITRREILRRLALGGLVSPLLLRRARAAIDLSGTGQYYSASSAAVTAVPLTMAAWFLPDNVTAGLVIAGVGRSGTANHYFYLESAGAVSGDPVVFGARGGGLPAYAQSPGGISTSAWNHAAGSSGANNSRLAYLNGVKGSENTSSQTPASLNTTDIGMVTTNTPVALFAGLIAEVGIWSVVLSDHEISSLAKGVAPIKVRPQSLVFYAPLIRNVQNVRGGLALTQTGSPAVAAHPRIYR